MTAGERRLGDAWAELEYQGATVHRIDTRGLAPHEVGALAEHEEARLRALAEGRDAGWYQPPAGATVVA